MYKADSKIAEEFIDHQEILDTLEYAHNNKSNRALIEQLIDKAAQFKGLSHREAALLLECDQPDLTERIFRLAQEIKHKFYGNRIVMFAPLYLSNYCVNGCVYCPYHLKNKTIARKKLTQEEIRKEVIALQDMGHKRLALEAGEDPCGILLSTYWNLSKPFIASNIKMGLSAGSMSTLPPLPWKTTAS